MELQPFQKRTWAEIDLDAASHNYKIIREQLDHNTKLCCVVKANGYGHGAVQLSKLYEHLGADYLAVSNIEEALQIRKAGVNLPILILGYTDPHCAEQLAENNISQCVFSYEYGKSLSEYAVEKNVNVNIHIKMDTGMGRIGFKCEPESWERIVEVCKLPQLSGEGIFTHFAVADEGDKGKAYTEWQFSRFKSTIEYLERRGIIFRLKHCANSAGIFDYPEMHLDMVRAGIVLYGLQPSGVLNNPGNLHPVMTLKTIIDFIKDVQAGDCISYGGEFRAEHDMKVATIPVGYADGLWRSNYRNHMSIEVEGVYTNLLGRVCMDQCMIDVSGIPDASVNSIVTVYGDHGANSVNCIAEVNNTINYEIVCALGERVPRVYKEKGCTVEIADNLI
ncbi:alanine racemase [Ruminococcus flavefaciens]|uniref:alanine racemase n=1 Tax=Ruminococcus flavefaciens TaxID=1265 RepID=UPI000318C327|nr:alanine racemase [Ruminococcus flavefaciens]